MVSQATQRVECRRRTASGWETAVYQTAGRVRLVSLGLDFAIAELYRGLDG
ncbi:MAG: hypothetical protein HC929_01920 [Leptolyngbyaceae cyanobacterium SM2_5_2]|nr:hypothetical protein [Leptolyngbyaceae cyanobacterium SM2_5_2]